VSIIRYKNLNEQYDDSFYLLTNLPQRHPILNRLPRVRSFPTAVVAWDFGLVALEEEP